MPSSATEVSADAFSSAWIEFFAAVRRARGRAAAEGGIGSLSLAQFQLVAAFERADELSVGALAEAGGVSAPTATRMLGALERDGIVTRRPSEEDRRGVIVSLTPEGKRLLADKRKAIRRKQQIVFEHLTPEERRWAVPVLHRLAEAMEEL